MYLKSPLVLFTGAVVIAALSSLVTWRVSHSDLREDTFGPVKALLTDNAHIVDALKKSEGVDTEGQILNAYLALIRKDGVPKHSDFKSQIDPLVNNNTAIVALVTRFADHGGSPDFRAAAHQYTDYATALRDRWQSVFELFMAGGNLPSGLPQGADALRKAIQ